MSMPIGVYPGEKFDQIEIYNDHITVKGRDGECVELSIKEMEWPASMKMCPFTDCRHYATIPDIGNCLLNLDRDYTLEEMGQILGGIGRERVRQLLDGDNRTGHHRQVGAMAKFNQRFRKLTRSKRLREVIKTPDPPVLMKARSVVSSRQLRGVSK